MISEILKQSLPSYEVTLPVCKKKYKFRPMTVREEKILLMALKSESKEEMSMALIQIIKNCFENLKNPENLAIADAEKAFISIRSKSMGEETSFSIRCPETGEPVNLKVNLESFELEKKKQKSFEIRLSDDMLLVVREPTIEYMLSNEQDTEKELFKNCFVELQTKNNTYSKTELSNSDIDEFYEYMTPKQIRNFMDFVDSIPRIRKKITYITSDGIQRSIDLFGIDSFFGYASAT
jgi:hypothetical protein